MKNCYIIMGASRGLGAEIAKLCLEPNARLICLSKNKNRELEELAQMQGVPFEYHSIDLNEAEKVESFFQEILQNISFNEVATISLILNAGVIAPIAPAGKLTLKNLTQNVNVNLTSQMLLIAQFIQHTQNWSKDKRIIHVNSGAGMNAYSGWGAYCATKAAMKLFCECVAKEQSDEPYPIKIFLFSPGIIDTDMQAEIRASSKADFKDVDQFIHYKDSGQLNTAEFVAKKFMKILFSDQYLSGSWIKLSDL